MKKFNLGILLVFIGIQVFGQSDIIYPAKGNKVIDSCEITQVKNGNVVYYTKDSLSNVIVAVAINQNGTYIALSNDPDNNNSKSYQSNQSGLYRGHDYDYYNKLYKRAKGSAGFGGFMTIIGLGGSIAGSVMTLDDQTNNDEAAFIATIAGAVLFNIGLPVWISSGVKKRNNKNAMEMTNRNTNLSFGTTNNGVGLVLNF